MPSTEYVGIIGLDDDVAEVFNNNALAVAGVDTNGNPVFIKGADAGYVDNVSVAGGGETTMTLVARGGQQIDGHAFSSGDFDILVRYQTPSGTTLRETAVEKNSSPDRWTDFKLQPKSDFIEIALINQTSSSQNFKATAHYK